MVPFTITDSVRIVTAVPAWNYTPVQTIETRDSRMAQPEQHSETCPREQEVVWYAVCYPFYSYF